MIFSINEIEDLTLDLNPKYHNAEFLRVKFMFADM